MPTESRNLERALPWIFGAAAFLLYLLTGARTIQWQDSGQFTYRIGTGTLWKWSYTHSES